MYNQNVSEKVRDISDRVSEAESVDEIFAIMTAFYKQYGVGMFGLNKAFRIRHDEGKELEFIPITNTDKVMLDDLIGYEIQKKKLVEIQRRLCLERKRITVCCLATVVPVNPQVSRQSLTSI